MGVKWYSEFGHLTGGVIFNQGKYTKLFIRSNAQLNLSYEYC